MLYLDNNATTKVDENVLTLALPFLTEDFGNAASTHRFGIKAHEAVKKARQQVASLLVCEPSEIIFTSGATEAINLTIKGLTNSDKKHIVTFQTEHSAVLDTCAYMESIGYEVDYLPVQANGLVDLEVIKSAIRPDTLLVAVMLANNEIGTIQPVKAITDLAHEKGAYLLTDATQAVGKIPINLQDLGADFLAFSGHKLHTPKGIGGLYVRAQRKTNGKNFALTPLQHGGGHEKGLRSGTLNVFGIVALGQACEIAQREMQANTLKISAMRDFLESELLKIENTFVNGSTENRLPNTTNICFEGVDSEAITLGLEDIAVSNGSACTAMKIEPSHVLKALGLTDEQAFQSIRLSLSKYNTMAEMQTALEKIGNLVKELREML